MILVFLDVTLCMHDFKKWIKWDIKKKKRRKRKQEGKSETISLGRKRKLKPITLFPLPAVSFLWCLFVQSYLSDLYDNPLGQDGCHLSFCAALTLSDSLDVKNSNNNFITLGYIRRRLLYFLILYLRFRSSQISQQVSG